MTELKTNFYQFDIDLGEEDNDNLCRNVIIEAKDKNHAKSIFEASNKPNKHYCNCCGHLIEGFFYDVYEIKLDEGYRVSVYAEYKDSQIGLFTHHRVAEERWFTLYGEFHRIEEPIWKTICTVKQFTGKIYFKSIEQYAQFIHN